MNRKQELGKEREDQEQQGLADQINLGKNVIFQEYDRFIRDIYEYIAMNIYVKNIDMQFFTRKTKKI